MPPEEMPMKPESSQQTSQPAKNGTRSESKTSAPGTEAARKGGVEPAKRQAEHDWQDSAKESGD